MPENRHGRLIAYRADRLGARLVSLMNAMRIAEHLGAEFACAWVETSGVGDVFNDPAELFDAGFVEDHFIGFDAWREIRSDTVPLRPGAAGTAAGLKDILQSGQDVMVGNAFGVILLNGEAEQEITPAFRAQLRRIPFSAPVSEAMAEIDRTLKGHAAYHIRRGDLTDDLKAMNKAWPHKMVPNEFYEMHMRERLDGDGGVVLFSDDADTIGHYRRKFPSLKIMGDIIRADDLTEAQRDLVEMYAMGRCSPIVAPERSAFSSTAADLFGGTKIPVTEALGEDLFDKAHESLMARIESDPESFSGEGDIGQSLAHVGNWLERKSRWDDAARLFSSQIREGLNISFVYPRALGYLHRTGDVQGALDTANTMQGRHVVHTRDFVNAEILHGYAHIRAGDQKTGLRHIVNGFWHGASTGLARNVVPLLVELGWLNDSCFLPVTALQRAIQMRRGPVKSLPQDLPGIETLPGVTVPDALGRLETALWDWGPLLRSFSATSAVRSGELDRVRKALQTATTGPELVNELAGQFAILDAFDGKVPDAIARLTDLTETTPDDWQLLQRISHCHWLARDFPAAAEAAVRAAERHPDSPLLSAWAGMTLSRARDRDKALQHLLAADAAQTGFASIPLLLAQVQFDLAQNDAALASVRRCRMLAPVEAEPAILEAKILAGTGDDAAAAAELLKLVEWQRAPGKAFVQLVNLLKRTGNTTLARETASIGAQRFPNHTRVVGLSEDLAA